MPRFLVKISEHVERYGYTVSAGAGTFPSTLQRYLVPLAKRLNWYGYEVT